MLEEAARSWKNRNGGVIVDGSSIELKDILRTIEGSMSGGSIMSGGLGLSRQNSLILDPAQNTSHAHTLLGLRPADALRREDSQSSMGLSSLAVGEDPEGGDDGPALDVRSWIRVVGAFEQPRLVYHVEKKHFET